jgi:hypothetical protein
MNYEPLTLDAESRALYERGYDEGLIAHANGDLPDANPYAHRRTGRPDNPADDLANGWDHGWRDNNGIMQA